MAMWFENFRKREGRGGGRRQEEEVS